jgi:phenylacetate-CoA ligase
MGRFDAMYARLPLWAQHGTITAYGAYWYWLRFGPGYAAHVADFASRDRWSADAWSTWQDAQVRRILCDAATHVPYYETTWDRETKQAALDGRLESIPRLSKDAVRADPRAFVRRDARPRVEPTFFTSGSTGTPIASIWTVDELRRSIALREVRSARWAGVSFSAPRATFSGRMVEPDPKSTGPFYRYNAVERQVYLSAFHLRRDTAAHYLRALATHRVQWLTGYAFSYFSLARFILDLGLTPPPLTAIVTTSEKVTPSMRAVMQDAFRCPVFEEYSTVENTLFASECERGRLHVSPDAGLVEILRPNGTRCDPGETGEVVATAIMRGHQPLIRYGLGDLASWDADACPCGRGMPVIREVVGRLEDAVVGPDGREMVRFHGLFVQQPHVREAQVVQETLTRIRIKVVPANGFNDADVQDIVSRTRQRLGDVQVVVEPVDTIPRSAAGKFRAVVSLLPQVRA